MQIQKKYPPYMNIRDEDWGYQEQMSRFHTHITSL